MKKLLCLVAILLVTSDVGWGTSISLTEGSNGVFSGTVALTAGASATDTITITPPANMLIDDLTIDLGALTGVGATGSGALATTLSNGTSVSNLTSTTSGGGTEHVTFADISSLTATINLSASATALGTATLTITPSFSPAPAVPEPGSIALFGTGLLALAWFVRRKMLTA